MTPTPIVRNHLGSAGSKPLGLGQLSKHQPGSEGDSGLMWVQLDNLRSGDILGIHTENQVYKVAVVGSRVGLMLSVSPSVTSGVYFLHGAYNLDLQEPIWGTMQVGLPALFAPMSSPGDSIKTSSVVKLELVRAGTYCSPYWQAATKPVMTSQGVSGHCANTPLVKPLVVQPKAPVPISKLGASPSIKPPLVGSLPPKLGVAASHPPRLPLKPLS